MGWAVGQDWRQGGESGSYGSGSIRVVLCQKPQTVTRAESKSNSENDEDVLGIL